MCASVVSLAKVVPLAVEVQAINRPLSMFGATTTVWNNAKYIPITNTFISMSYMQANYGLVNLYKTGVVVQDLNKESK